VTTHVAPGDIHNRVWELLPWVVNGRLTRTDQTWVMRHIEECADCRREIEAQVEIQSVLASDARVAYAPQSSFQKLTSRIEELERPLPDNLPQELARTPGMSIPAAVPRFPRWLAATLAAQGAVVVALVVLVGWQSFERMLAPSYQTLTSAQPSTAIAGNVRVVLTPAVTVSQFQSLLESVNARVVAGPTEAHVWTLAVPYAKASPQFAAVIRLLRSDPRIALAEPVTTAESGR
jgi:hypothetical protein